MHPSVRADIDSAQEQPEEVVAQARFVIGSHWGLDVADPQVMLAAMAGATYVAHVADKMLAVKMVGPVEHAMLTRTANAAADVWANAVRFCEANMAPAGDRAAH